MSIEDYKQAGFMITTLMTQAVIDRAEKDVMQAYIEPIAPNADTMADGEAREALMQLAFLLILQRSIFATRSGAKEKQTLQSQSADRWSILSQESATSLLKLERLAVSEGVNRWQDKVTDICGILFTTQHLFI